MTNLPLRPPVVLAKAAATIDILSGGRFELGFGAGGIGEAIRSVGGPDLPAGERIAAAEEAIDIMRGIWRGDGSMVKHRGKHYDIPGARSGPKPAVRAPPMPRSCSARSFTGTPQRRASESRRPIASVKAMTSEPARPMIAKTSKGWRHSSI